MRINLKHILFLLVIGSAVLACAFIPGNGNSGGGSPGDILFEDDFAYIFSGWPRYADELSSMDFSGGGYEINVFESDYVTWATSGELIKNADIQVEVTFVSGEFDSYFGIICRHVDINNFYALTISNDGYFGISKTIDAGPFTLIGKEFLDYSDSIKQGIDTNLVRARCEENRLALYVNNDLLLEVQDDDLSGGEVGLIVGNDTGETTTIFFDNFIVRVP